MHDSTAVGRLRKLGGGGGCEVEVGGGGVGEIKRGKREGERESRRGGGRRWSRTKSRRGIERVGINKLQAGALRKASHFSVQQFTCKLPTPSPK